MRLGFIIGTNTSDYDPTCALEFQATDARFASSLADSAAAAGTSVDSLLAPVPSSTSQQERFGESGRRLAAVLLGINDVLIATGLVPAAVGGLSLGALVSSCLAGGLDRPSLFSILEATVHAPGPGDDEPAQATALAALSDDDPVLSDPIGVAGLYIGGDLGRPVDGTGRLVMLSGHRLAVEKFAAQRPAGVVTVVAGNSVAVHTLLRKRAQDFVAPTIDRVRFTDPGVVLCSCFEPATVTTAAGVRDIFLRNMIERFDLTSVLDEMVRHDVGLLLALGPTLPAGVLEFPMPVVHVDTPDHVTEAVGAAVDLGIQLGAPPLRPSSSGAHL